MIKTLPKNEPLRNLPALVVVFLLLTNTAAANTIGHGLDVCAIKPITDAKITPNYPLSKLNCKNSIEITLAQDEFEPASFIIKSDTDYKSIDIRLSTLSFDEHIYPSGYVDIRYVKTWCQAPGAWSSHRRVKGARVLIPELLVKDPTIVNVDTDDCINYLKSYTDDGYKYLKVEGHSARSGRKHYRLSELNIMDSKSLTPIQIKKNELQQIWLTARSDTNLVPGVYHGFVELMSEGTVLKKLPIKIRLLDFKLPKPKMQYSIYYRGKLSSGPTVISSEYKNRQQYQNELTNMKDHGICCPTSYQRLFLKHAKQKKWLNDPRSLFKEHLKIREKHGLLNDGFFYLGLPIDASRYNRNLTALKRGIDITKSYLKSYDVGVIYFYGKDEAKGSALRQQQKVVNYAQSHGVKVFTAGTHGHMDAVKGATDVLVYYNKANKEASDNAHSYGKKIFQYAQPQSGVENPLKFRNNYGLNLVANGFDGAMVYAYQDSMGYIWDDYDHPNYRDHALTYPTANGVIDTIAWEGLREAVDDTRYYQLLINQMSSLQLNEDTKISIINDVVSAIDDNPPEQVRNLIIKHIQSLLNND